jgi:hypothetical protein
MRRGAFERKHVGRIFAKPTYSQEPFQFSCLPFAGQFSSSLVLSRPPRLRQRGSLSKRRVKSASILVEAIEKREPQKS